MQSLFAPFQPDRWYESFALIIGLIILTLIIVFPTGMWWCAHCITSWLGIFFKKAGSNEILGKVREGTGISTFAHGYVLWKWCDVFESLQSPFLRQVLTWSLYKYINKFCPSCCSSTLTGLWPSKKPPEKIKIHSVSERDSSQHQVALAGKLSISSAMLD